LSETPSPTFSAECTTTPWSSPSKEALNLVPYETAKRFLAFPLRLAGNTLQITMAEPTDSLEIEQLQDIVQKSLTVCVSTAKDIIEGYKKFYKISDEEYQSFFKYEPDRFEDDSVTQVEDFGALVSDAAEDFEIESSGADDGGFEQFSASDAPIIKLVNGILVKAVQEGVSDIHIEPFEKTMQVRYRKDGSLFKSMNLPLTIKNAMASISLNAGFLRTVASKSDLAATEPSIFVFPPCRFCMVKALFFVFLIRIPSMSI
jgi:type IV pilus assembly protein PilB